MSNEEILVTTLESVPGYKVVKVLGVVSGSIVLARNIGRDITAALRNIAGGEIKEYTELLAYSRDVALERMKEKARKMGANAVLGLRFSSSAVMSGAAETLAYGTAVVIEPE
ncbi:MAG TPA: YbjQ family protein [Thermoprotei archaeon]|nr:YbjQ family protein [Thermoprotei archaeon]